MSRTNAKIEKDKRDYSREELTTKLLAINDGRQKRKREVSPHVCTRYYRAPEVIVCERRYKSCLDMWSVGCILAEIIYKQSDYQKLDSSTKTLLFPGTHCEPLSPAKGRSKKGLDQMHAILEVLSPLDDADTCFITD